MDGCEHIPLWGKAQLIQNSALPPSNRCSSERRITHHIPDMHDALPDEPLTTKILHGRDGGCVEPRRKVIGHDAIDFFWHAPIGSALRRSSLDELPQLWSVLVGEMSLVGPRPALFNQQSLIAARELLGVHRINPGITGLAQVSGRDELSDEAKVHLDAQYLSQMSLILDAKILARTVLSVIRSKGVQH